MPSVLPQGVTLHPPSQRTSSSGFKHPMVSPGCFFTHRLCTYTHQIIKTGCLYKTKSEEKHGADSSLVERGRGLPVSPRGAVCKEGEDGNRVPRGRPRSHFVLCQPCRVLQRVLEPAAQLSGRLFLAQAA